MIHRSYDLDDDLTDLADGYMPYMEEEDEDCRSHDDIHDDIIAARLASEQTTQAAIDANGLRPSLLAAEAAHAAIVAEQRQALDAATAGRTGRPRRSAAREVATRYQDRLAASSRRIAAVRDAAREAR